MSTRPIIDWRTDHGDEPSGFGRTGRLYTIHTSTDFLDPDEGPTTVAVLCIDGAPDVVCVDAMSARAEAEKIEKNRLGIFGDAQRKASAR